MQQKLHASATRSEPLTPDQIRGDSSSDDDPFMSEAASIAEKPYHLRLLFHNDCLRMEGVLLSEASAAFDTGTTSTTATRLLRIARNTLQRLIPPKREISDLTRSASKWLTMLHSFFPLPGGPKCGADIMADYEGMQNPNVDPVRLASWLLTVTLMAEQLPPEHQSRSARPNDGCDRKRWLSSAISEAVERNILSHDTLTGSIQGLSAFMWFIRLEMGRGNVYKAWVKLRHVITVAELLGLHNMTRVAQFGATTEAADQAYISKVQLWDLICATDRLLGMVLNLPPITRHHRQTHTNAVSIGGIVQHQRYLGRLTDISKKIPDLDYLNISERPRTEEYTFALDLFRELQVLASQTPPAWWSGELHGAKSVDPSHLVQFLHHYIAMRIHLPLTLRQGPGEESLSNCLSCVDACTSIIKLYQLLSPKLPPGLFLCEMLDLQVFAAAVALLLVSHMSRARFFGAGVDRIKINHDVGHVIRLLRERSRRRPDSGIAQNGFTALSSLNGLLSEAENGLDLRQIAFQIPLLGKVYVRCNQHLPEADSDWSSQLLSTLGLCGISEEMPYPDFDFSLPMLPSFDAEELR
ncbi:hypothetical protein AbraIFM66951_004195 [Aspergillus brasiliensis]|uniref:Transcription factor domain-containing protein n=1 Tax=Aspergillus brasiliensis TaxID=319629 RepID=A0A9W5Z0A0_9EURO|nr:hypothetical protein AbraCBS73388_004633 [Aspergillus brasiliensis]GKZ50828.1 hypothetical protein AbraIFM66951_004195 [Aspergillus brasiliensis]